MGVSPRRVAGEVLKTSSRRQVVNMAFDRGGMWEFADRPDSGRLFDGEVRIGSMSSICRPARLTLESTSVGSSPLTD